MVWDSKRRSKLNMFKNLLKNDKATIYDTCITMPAFQNNKDFRLLKSLTPDQV